MTLTAPTRDTFADLVNGLLDQEDPQRLTRRFSLDEGRQAFDHMPADLQPDQAVRTFVDNVLQAFREIPDNGSD